jgi:acylphosphatase
VPATEVIFDILSSDLLHCGLFMDNFTPLIRPSTLKRSYKITVKGKVQGVNYRRNAQAKAHELGLTGFVMNRHDGSVLLRAEGAEDKINKFIEWCHVGPRNAEVLEVNAEEQEAEGFPTFEVRR